MKKHKFQTCTEKQAKKLITKTFESELDDSQLDKYIQNKNKLFDMISKEVDCILDKEIEKVLQEQIFNAFKVSPELFGKGASTSSFGSKFSLEQFEKAIEKIKKLPPIVIRIEVFPQGYMHINYIFKEFIFKDTERVEGNKLYNYSSHPALYNGIDIAIVEEDYELKFNQGRLIYNDGSSKIIDIFEVKD